MKKILFILLFTNTLLFGNNPAYPIKKDVASLYTDEEIQKAFDQTLANYNEVRNIKDTMHIDRIIPVYRYSYDSYFTNLNAWDQLQFLEKNNLNDIPLPKDDFINNRFYSNLRKTKTPLFKTCVDIIFYFTDIKDQLIGYGDPSVFSVQGHYNDLIKRMDQSFIDQITKLKIEDLFIIDDVGPYTYWGKTSNDLVYIFNSKNHLFIPLEDYIEKETEIFK